MNWMITFDVGSDADRRSIHRLLGRYGIRVLHTAYEIEIDDRPDLLFARLAEHIRPGDHLLAIPCCPQCEFAAHGGAVEGHAPQGWVIS